MMDPLSLASNTAFSGLFAQSLRMKVVAQNIANSESTGTTPGADAYRRRTVTFSNALGSAQANGAEVTAAVGYDMSDFGKEFMPSHHAADKNGYVKTPNVNMIVEMTDMRQALRSYEANLQVIRQSRDMANSLVDLLKSNG
jgi:flagellar basal-body rod protein FlgC